MQRPAGARKIVFARAVDGIVEHVDWIRHADTVWIVAEGSETVLRPEAWKPAWDDLAARGFVEVYSTFQPELKVEKERVVNLIRTAFWGVTLGKGIGLQQANEIDNYSIDKVVAAARDRDEKLDWSAIPLDDLRRYHASVGYFDAEGMRFHLPAFLIADLEETSNHACILFHLAHLKNLGTSRFASLNDSQRQAVREYLLLQLAGGEYETSRSEIEEALRDYWT